MSDLRCPCGKRGSVGLKANVERHMKKCKYMKQTGTQPSRVQAQTDTEIELIAAKQRIVDLLTENSTLKTENITLKRHGANVNITNNNTIQINITPFQYVNADGNVKITNEAPLPSPSLVRPILNLGIDMVPKYLSLKHFKKEHPNIKLTNIKLPYLKVLRRNEGGFSNWVQVDRQNTLEDMVLLGVEELEDVYGAMEVPIYAAWEARVFTDGVLSKTVMQNIIKSVELEMLENRTQR